MWNLYLVRALDLSAERRRETERRVWAREARQTTERGPRRTTRRPIERIDTGR